MAKEVKIELTEAQKAKIKAATGKNMSELKVTNVGANVAVSTSEKSPRGAGISEQGLRGAERVRRGEAVRGAEVAEAGLRGAEVAEAGLRGAEIGEAGLRGAEVAEAGLRGAEIGEAGLRGAEMSEAGLRGAEIGEAGLRGAEIGEAGLREEGLREEGLREEGLREEGLREEGLREEGLREEGLREEGLREEGLRSAPSKSSLLGNERPAKAGRFLFGGQENPSGPSEVDNSPSGEKFTDLVCRRRPGEPGRLNGSISSKS